MSDLLPGLVVLAIGGSIAPPLLLLTILFLGSQRPLPNAGALMLGYFTTCALIGISGITLFGGAEDAVSTVGRVISVTVGVLLLVLGLRTVLAPPDPDSTPPKWMESIDSMSPPRAFGFGMVLFPLQVKNLAIFVASLNLSSCRTSAPKAASWRSGSCSSSSPSRFSRSSASMWPLRNAPRRCWSLCGRGWRRTTVPSRSYYASYSEHSSSSEVSWERENMGNRGSGTGEGR
jgi:hypothetical protein